MSDYISNADEIEFLSDVLSDCHLDEGLALPPPGLNRAPSHSSSRSTSRSTSMSSSAHETSTDYHTR